MFAINPHNKKVNEGGTLRWKIQRLNREYMNCLSEKYWILWGHIKHVFNLGLVLTSAFTFRDLKGLLASEGTQDEQQAVPQALRASRATRASKGCRARQASTASAGTPDGPDLMEGMEPRVCPEIQDNLADSGDVAWRYVLYASVLSHVSSRRT